jgi:uncharacterized iron-regulated protein
MTRPFLAGLTCAALSACAPPHAAAPPTEGLQIHDSRGDPVAWRQLIERLAEAEVVFNGEHHDDATAHRIERRLAEALGSRRPLVVGMEMFERDVQSLIDRYLSGGATEERLLAEARPWRNYVADYRPVVELARTRGWPVIASNVPRRITLAIMGGGLDTLRHLSTADRALAAAELECPEDEYYRRFMERWASTRGWPRNPTSPSA